MTNEATLYRAYIIRCPQNSERSTRTYFLKNSEATHYESYTDAEALLKALERELAPVQPAPSTGYLRRIAIPSPKYVKERGHSMSLS